MNQAWRNLARPLGATLAQHSCGFEGVLADRMAQLGATLGATKGDRPKLLEFLGNLDFCGLFKITPSGGYDSCHGYASSRLMLCRDKNPSNSKGLALRQKLRHFRFVATFCRNAKLLKYKGLGVPRCSTDNTPTLKG